MVANRKVVRPPVNRTRPMSQLIRTPPTQPGSALRCTTRPYRGPQTARSDRSGVGQDLGTIAGHQQGVLALGTAATVLGDHRPVVLPHVPLVGDAVGGGKSTRQNSSK